MLCLMCVCVYRAQTLVYDHSVPICPCTTFTIICWKACSVFNIIIYRSRILEALWEKKEIEFQILHILNSNEPPIAGLKNL